MENPVSRRRIGEHGVIGDLAGAALVALDGTVDFLCWPNLDNATIFAGLLDPAIGGGFDLAALGDGARSEQTYRAETNILITRWITQHGEAELYDLMQDGVLVRSVTAIYGQMHFRLRCWPRPDYARGVPDCAEAEGGVVFTGGAGPRLRLASSVALSVGAGEAVAEWAMHEGETVHFVLQDEDRAVPSAGDVRRAIDDAAAFWRAWSAAGVYPARWRVETIRSALVLKLLASRQHGAFAAAVTFSLPELPGGGRNWDYRAAWIRDGALTADALLRLGHRQEAADFHAWVARCARDADGGLQVMYAIDGTEAAAEMELDHLAGYGGARPVRIGNAARGQFQLDIHGEYLDSLLHAGAAIAPEDWPGIVALADYVCRHWREADSGIWELRGGPRAHLHSRLLCWVALDRAIRLSELAEYPAPRARWVPERESIARDIWENFRHPEHGHFVQARGGGDLDAALLMMPLTGFVAGTDPVWLATLDAITEELTVDGLVYRYRNEDGLAGGEGAFAACSFWYVECLALALRLDEAQRVMAHCLGRANHLGLFSEEWGAVGEALGNFPQALTHAAFINAACRLDGMMG